MNSKSNKFFSGKTGPHPSLVEKNSQKPPKNHRNQKNHRSDPKQPHFQMSENPIVRTREEFKPIFEEILETGVVGIDTEFHSEKRYYPDLFLIQMGSKNHNVAIDPLEFNFQDLLAEIIGNKKIVKIFHAPQTDIKLLYYATGAKTMNLFDTQLAASFVGIGAQVSYNTLLKEVLKQRSAPPTSTMSDWSKRPLSREQLEYALADVAFLIPIYEELEKRIKKLGRKSWFLRASAKFSEDSFYKRDIDSLYLRFKEAPRLSKEYQHILYSLIEWREEKGAELNLPTRVVLNDFQMLEIVKIKPENFQELEKFRGIPPGVLRRHGREIIQAVLDGLKAKRKLPELPKRETSTVRYEGQRLELVRFFLKVKSENWKISPELILNAEEIRNIVRHPPKTIEDLKIFEEMDDKKAEELKTEVWKLLSGEYSIGFDSRHRVVLKKSEKD